MVRFCETPSLVSIPFKLLHRLFVPSFGSSKSEQLPLPVSVIKRMSSSSPANSSISTTAVAGGGSITAPLLDDFHFPSDHVSVQQRKDDAMRVIKSDLMAALNNVVKSLDEDNWMFQGPRSCIHLISRPGGFSHKQIQVPKSRSMAPPK